MATRPWPLRLTARIASHFTVTAVVAACLGLFGQEANALALGRITVQSALGEPLRAEIDIPDINPDEVSSLRPALGSVEAFRRAGLEYNSVLAGVQVTLQRRADGRSYLRLSSDRVINEPFLDLVIEAKWAAGQLVRDYTLLLDPPLARQNAVTPSVTTAPVISPQAAGAAIAAARTPPPVAITPAAAPAPSIAATPKAPPAATPTAPLRVPPARAKATAAPKEPPSPRDDRQVTVHAGDTASKIAATVKPTAVSLDQMLVALLRANPNAFTAGNVNRLKAGAVLDVPGADTATTTPVAEASQIVLAQSRDFNDFRRKLASGATVAQVDAPKRTSSGKVQTQIQDKKPSDASPDKLSLQKGELKDKTSQDKIAKDLRDNDAAKRLAELNKNISDLSKLAAVPAPAAVASAAANTAASPAKPASASTSAPTTAVTVAPVVAATVTATLTATATATTSLPAAVTSTVTATTTLPAATPTTAPAPAAVASAPAEKASAPVSAASKPAMPAPAEASLVSDLLDNPLVPAGAGGLVALLAGLALYRIRQRRKATQVDSSFMESRLQPDSFFGSSGGHKIDTSDAVASGSSMMYSPSQLDAGADVDPVAEADVYLAYGRDLQAEEILKEALRSNPSRAAIHFKLLQIYAKRQDVKAYAASATEAYKLTQGLGTDWSAACMTGRELDPTNPLYQGDNVSSIADMAAESATQPTQFLPSEILPLTIEAPAGTPSVDLDLDLDFSAAEPGTAPGFDTAPPDFTAAGLADSPSPAERTISLQTNAEVPPLPDLEIEFDTPEADTSFDAASLPSLDFDVAPPAAQDGDALNFTHSDLVELLNTPTETAAIAPDSTPANPDDMLEFDLDSLSLDLDSPAPLSAETNLPETSPSTDDDFDFPQDAEADGADPLVTKLALAEEFQAIGDDDGARTLAQEVVDEATGNLKAKAQRFLAELG